jgi:Raf kinase inhibitor-like YbhB/YbcL family protein
MINRILLLGIALWISNVALPVAADQQSLGLSSPAFRAGSAIPAQYTCAGADDSPPLRWTVIPPSAKALALVVVDPDAPGGTFTHWVVYNVDPASHGLAVNALKSAKPAASYPQGTNSFGHVGYNGPCPPPGKPHHYHFKLYALATPLELPSGASVAQVDAAMRGQVLASGELVGTFAR